MVLLFLNLGILYSHILSRAIYILDLFFFAYVLQHDNALRTSTKEHYTFVTIINHLHDGKYIYCCEYTYCLREIQHARFEFLRFGYVNYSPKPVWSDRFKLYDKVMSRFQ